MSDLKLAMPAISMIDSGPTEAVTMPLRPAEADGSNGHHSQLLIIGSGPAGLTAAIYAARAGLAPIVLGGSAPGGQLMITSEVENYPGFPEGIQGPELMARFRDQAARFGSTIVDVDVQRVDLTERPFQVWAAGVRYTADALIVATGASALWLGLDSETRLRGRGVSACATCDGFFFKGKRVAVVGGGDTALEEATFLTRFAPEVVLIHRRDQFRGSRIMQQRAIDHPGIDVRWNTEVAEVLGDDAIQGLRLRDTQTGREWTEPFGGLFIAIGYRPNTEVFRGWLPTDAAGYLEVEGETGSVVEGVFIAGDVHDHRYRQAVTAAADGCKAAMDAERWLEMHAPTPAPSVAVPG
jgi:thioredoxin reductase (NADPH)